MSIHCQMTVIQIIYVQQFCQFEPGVADHDNAECDDLFSSD